MEKDIVSDGSNMEDDTTLSQEQLVKELVVVASVEQERVSKEILAEQVEDKLKKVLSNPSAVALDTALPQTGVELVRIKKTVRDLFTLYLTNQFVARAIQIRADTLISKGYNVVGEDAKGVEACKELIEKSGGVNLFWQLSTNTDIAGNGFLEKIYNQKKTKIMRLKHVHPLTMDFRKDQYGNVIIDPSTKEPIGYSQIYKSAEGAQEYQDIPKEIIEHLKFNTLGDEFGGISTIQPGYDTIVRLMNMEYSAAEAAVKIANPIIIAECNTKSPQQVALWGQTLGRINGREQLFVPEGMKISLLSPGNQNFTDYAPYFLNAVVACFDDETELLTEDGWKLFKDLDRTEKVAQFNKDTKKITYSLPTNYIIKDFDGELIEFKNKFVDFSVTPEHRILYHNYLGKRNNFDVEEAEILYNKKSPRILIPQAGTVDGIQIDKMIFESRDKENSGGYPETTKFEIDGDTFCEFMGLFLGDGWTELANNKIFICASDVYPENVVHIRDVLDKMGVSYHDYSAIPKDRVRSGKKFNTKQVPFHKFWFANRALSEYLKQFGKARDKFIPREIKDSTSEQIKKFLRGYWITDGSGKDFEKGISFGSISEKLIDDTQELLLKIGRPSTKYFNKTYNSYELYTRFEKRYGRENSYVGVYRNSIKKRKYNGKVYCVSVPDTFIVIRKNGRTVITGNCFGVPKSVLLGEGGSNRAEGIILSRHFYSVIRGNQNYMESFFNKIFEEYGELAGFTPPVLTFDDIAEDVTLAAQAAMQLFQSGIISQQEARAMIGLDPKVEGVINPVGASADIKKADRDTQFPASPGKASGSQSGIKVKRKTNPLTNIGAKLNE